jgi:methylase of polypeptide subunit release factors
LLQWGALQAGVSEAAFIDDRGEMIPGWLKAVVAVLLPGLAKVVSKEFWKRIVANAAPDSMILTGHYRTAWQRTPFRQEKDLVDVRHRAWMHTVTITTEYSIDPDTHYTMEGTMSHPNVVDATWRSTKNPTVHGQVQFTYDPQGRVCRGRWTGVSSNDGEVHGGRWEMAQLDTSQNREVPRLQCSLQSHGRALRQIIEEHAKKAREAPEGYYVNIESPKGPLSLRIVKGVFDPSLGRVSPHLLRYAAELPGESILDLGCGSGYMAIYLAKTRGASVAGIDLNPVAIQESMYNAGRNGVGDRVKFYTGDLFAPIYEDYKHDVERFDLIVANLPFTREEWYREGARSLGRQMRSEYRPMFCCDGQLLKRMILGSQFYLRPGGRLVFAVGGSSDLESIDSWIARSGLTFPQRRIIHSNIVKLGQPPVSGHLTNPFGT